MSEAQRRLAAIVAINVAGYSRLMGRDEQGTLAVLKSHRNGLLIPKRRSITAAPSSSDSLDKRFQVGSSLVVPLAGVFVVGDLRVQLHELPDLFFRLRDDFPRAGLHALTIRTSIGTRQVFLP